MTNNTPNIGVSQMPGALRFWMTALVLISGNVVLPQFFHLIPGGGPMWLPIYFFTLIASWRYGFKMGFTVAVISPIINTLIFGMPSQAMLLPILMKSVILAFSAAALASRYGKVTIALVLSVVLTYQFAGTLGEWAIFGDFMQATQDFRVGIPGMIVQTIGAYLLLRILSRK